MAQKRQSSTGIESSETKKLKTSAEPTEFHPKLVQALSSSSGLFGVLWPAIVIQAPWDVRCRIIRNVNHYFRDLCDSDEHRRSDRAKSTYFGHYGNVGDRADIPCVLDLSAGVEWRCWGADKAGFGSIDNFREFCAIGDVDPDAGVKWDPYAKWNAEFSTPRLRSVSFIYMWMSREKDVVFETSCNPADPGTDGYCHYLGLHGCADKAIAMYEYLRDRDGVRDPETLAAEMAWYREWI